MLFRSLAEDQDGALVVSVRGGTRRLVDGRVEAPEAFPDAAAAYEACLAASLEERREGNVGAGCGASVGHMLGPAGRTKGGLGLAGDHLESGATMGAIADAVRWAEEIMKAIDERWPTIAICA